MPAASHSILPRAKQRRAYYHAQKTTTGQFGFVSSAIDLKPAQQWGQSMLFDAGWPASNNRQASTGRFVEVAKAAGFKRIDLLVISHFDVDHLGDVAALAAEIPIRHIFDHGGSQTNPRFAAYAAVRDKIGHTVLKPGDKVPIKGLDIQFLTAG